MPKPKARSAPQTPTPKTKAGRGWLRIIGGIWRGRKIAVPEATDVRPTNERAREAIFNRLMHAEELLGVRLKGAVVADLFAGTGALGLEALSRGATSATFVERDGAACKTLKQTIQTLDIETKATVLHADATTLASGYAAFDIVFMDPPYQANAIGLTLAALHTRAWVRPGTLIVAESQTGSALELPPGFTLIDQRRYGRADIAFIGFKN